MMVTKAEIRSGAYYDSVVLMQLQRSLAALPGVLDAGVVMGTDANKDILAQSDLLTSEAQSAVADDLVIVICAEDDAAVQAALDQVDELLTRRPGGVDQEYRPKSLESAAQMLPDARWVLVSVPGRYAAGVARQALPQDLAPLWVFDVPEGIESSAAIADGVVYVGGLDGGLYVVDLSTGKLRWRYEAGEEIKSSPSIQGTTVFFGDANGTFHAVDTRSGSARWTFQAEAEIVSSANFAGERVVFGSHDQFVYCLSVADGSLLWKAETDAARWQLIEPKLD